MVGPDEGHSSSSRQVSVHEVNDSVITGAAKGNESGIRTSSLQASIDKKNLSLLSVMYTICCDILSEYIMCVARTPMFPIVTCIFII